MDVIEGQFTHVKGHYAIVAARFNELIVERLVDGAVDTLRRHGVSSDDVTLVRVPGAFEIPVVVDKLAASGRYAGVIALGCVIRGATAHFDYVAGSCTSGLADAASKHGIPVVFGVLTTDTIEQAMERAGSKAGNKGAEAAATALEMVDLLSRI